MLYKSLKIFFLFLLISHANTNGQVLFNSKIEISNLATDSFSFTKKWSYAWDIEKNAKGKFSTPDGRKLKRADTAHLFYTANCKTNVQGGYTIRYCYARMNVDTITITFTDGLPAYASIFYIYIKGDSFYFRPQTIYPAYSRDEKITYEINKETLKLDNAIYRVGKNIRGYIDVEFTQVVSLPNKTPLQTKLFLRGYFNTNIKLRWPGDNEF